MNYIEAIIMGIFQGIAEFLPISSSGHLAILQNLFGINEGNMFFTVMLHFGTLISICIVYFNQIKEMIIEFFKLVYQLIKREPIGRLSEPQRMAIMVLVGTVPTGIIGLTFEDFFESLYTSMLPIGIALIVTGFLLWISERVGTEKKEKDDFKIKDALIIGIYQGLAIIPGISRSGSTIVAGLFRGFKKPIATEYSFLLALPVTFGAFLLGLRSSLKGGESMTINGPLVLGVVLSAIIGVFAIKLLIKVLNSNKLKYFSFYLWFVGSITIITTLIK